jgi:hypothetical protein
MEEYRAEACFLEGELKKAACLMEGELKDCSLSDGRRTKGKQLA